MKETLTIKDLYVCVQEKEIVKGLSIEVKQGEIHALMGPNGSGKSTLSYTIMGHPKYSVKSGDILFNNNSVLGLKPQERAQLGLFLSFQYPLEIPGVRYSNFLRLALNSKRKSQGLEPIQVTEFNKILKQEIKNLEMDESFAIRYLNEGFSGGEKKRSEILQLAVLKPKIAILDETDSGLDIDSIRVVAKNINNLAQQGIGILVITHYQRILKYLNPDFVHVMLEGKVIKSGDHALAEELEQKGYSNFIKEVEYK